MSKKILVYGFGRMGISHSVMLSGLLGATECEFSVVGRSIKRPKCWLDLYLSSV